MDHKIKSETKAKKNFIVTRYKLILIVTVLIIGLGVAGAFISSTSSVFNFAFPRGILKQEDERVNILLLGNAGGKHDGAWLTDSIIVASYYPKNQQVVLVSIPRDLWLPDLQIKVNAVYEIGEEKGGGLKFAREQIGNILDLPLHFAVRVDFAGFAKAIDIVGGIDLEAPVSFDDYNYPIAGKENDLCGNEEKEIDLTEEQAKVLNVPVGRKKVILEKSGKLATEAASFACRFERISFKKGSIHMNGTTALKFVRSRMGTNGEGSDFARSRRQQLVLQAFKDRALSFETLLNPGKISELLKTFGNSIETDIPPNKFLELSKIIRKIDRIESIVLGDLGGGKSFLVTPPAADYGGAWVLLPQKNDFSVIGAFMRNALEKNATNSALTKE